MSKLLVLIVTAALVLSGGVVYADTTVVTFQQGLNGYAGCQDTLIRARIGEGYYDQDKNYGARLNFHCAGFPYNPDTSKAVGSLVRFNDIFGDGQGQVPVAAHIVSATLKLYAYEINGYGGTHDDVRIYRMDTTWVEGGGNGSLQPGASCANARCYREDGNYAANPDDAWGDSGVVEAGPVVGVDYSSFSKRRFPMPADMLPTWMTFDITPYMIEWQNSSSPNVTNGIYGFTGSSWSEAYFHSSEYDEDTTLRPILEVEYEPVGGEMMVFQNGLDGYTGCEDTYVRPRANDPDPDDPTKNYGSDEKLVCKGAFESSMIIGAGTLIRFDDLFGEGEGQIHLNQEIVRVDLMLYAYHLYTYSEDWDNVRAHPLTNTWVQGTAIGVAQEGSSCGEARRYRADGDYATYPEDAWGDQGQIEEKGPQDYSKDFCRDSATRVEYGWPFYEGNQDRQPRWMNFDITEYVIGEDGNSGWRADEDDNYGVYLYTGGGNSSAYFRSSDYIDGACYRPKLVIEYRPFACGHSEVPYPDTDLSGPDGVRDCYVDIHDFATMCESWMRCTLPGGADCEDLGATYTIPHGSVTVDADLTEWADAEWIDLDETYSGTPIDITNAKFALKWDANDVDHDHVVYAAVVVTDTSHVLEYFTSWDSSDQIEIYCQADLDAGAIYIPWFDKAQQYRVGLDVETGIGKWAFFGAGEGIEAEAEFQYAVAVDGDDIIYEIGAKQFDYYAGHRPGGTTVEAQLEGGKEIGFDIVAATKMTWGTFGMKSENMMTGKSTDARQFQRYTLEHENGCGHWGYFTADIDGDCDVDLADLSALTSEWLYCTEVGDPRCDNTWMP